MLPFDLTEVNFSGANLSYSDLRGCKITRGKGKGCKFTQAKLSGVDFGSCDLSEADLQYSDLSGANLHEAQVAEANFCHAYGLGKQTTAKLRDQGALVDPDDSKPDQNQHWQIEKVYIPIAVAIIALCGAILPLFVDKSPPSDPNSQFPIPSERLEKEKEQK